MSKLSRRKFLGAAAGSAVAAALKPSELLANRKNFQLLPPPSTEPNESLIAALRNRKSTRSFNSKPIPDQILSNLLWAAFGINRPEMGYRTAPSPKNSQEIEIYLAKQDGAYLYDPGFHQLVKLSEEDIRSYTGSQRFVSKAPLNLIYVANFSRLGNREDEKKYFYAAADTGFIGQNVYLFCAAFGLGTVIRDWVNRPALAKKLQLREDQKIILAQTVGYPE